ncbi:MAG: Holliday junction resolvase RuvX [Candidatus Kapaibacterium sp.]
MNILKEKLKGVRIAGIDYGTKRIGIAVCDELHISVKPVETVLTDKENYIDEICRILTAERIGAIVLGMPDTFDGQKTEFHGKIQKFGDTIRNELNSEIYYVDESFSSMDAATFMVNYGIKKKERAKKGTLDKYSALMILQQFLDELE